MTPGEKVKLFWKIVGLVIVLIIVVIIIAYCKAAEEAEKARMAALRDKAERARREAEGRDWRKAGVVTSYRNRGMMEVARRCICPICKKEQYRDIGDGMGIHYAPCPTCEKHYEQDVEDKVLPPGVPVGSRGYNFEDWYALRLIEYELRNGTISADEARAMQQSAIKDINDSDAAVKQRIRMQEYAKNHPDTSYRNNYEYLT